MEITDILKPQAVRLLSSTSSKKRLFQELSDILDSVHTVPAQTALEALLAREELGPTGVGKGIALPHARLPELDHVVGAFARLEKPIEFGAVDRQPVDLVFALFAPQDAGVDHLKALALVSRTLRDTVLCEKLRANNDPATLHAVLTETRAQAA